MIAHNEERCIGDTLDSVQWADQIVVIDCSSSDATCMVARDKGAEVYSEPNREGLNINKNIAISRCNGDWILVLDADEVIPDCLAGEIRYAINEDSRDGYFIPRRNIVLGRWLQHGAQYPDRQLRLFRRGMGAFPEEYIHERIRIDGRTGTLKHPMDHYPYRNVRDMIRKGSFYVEYEAQHLHYSPIGLSFTGIVFKAALKPCFRFIRRYFWRGGFLDGVPGLAAAYFDAWNQAVRWIWLWDILREKRMPKDT